MRALVAWSWLLLGCSGAKVALPYAQSFESPLGREWYGARLADWRVQEGRLCNDGAENEPLWLDRELPANVRVSFRAESKSPQVDMKFEIFGDGKKHQSGYVVILGGWKNSKNIIARRNEHGPERSAARDAELRQEFASNPEGAAEAHADSQEIVVERTPWQPNRSYVWVFERRGPELTLSVDGAPVLRYFDPAPLQGSGHEHFAFNNWASRLCFDDLRIEAL